MPFVWKTDTHFNKNLPCGYLMCMLRVGTSWLAVTYNQLFNGAQDGINSGLVFVAHMCTLLSLLAVVSEGVILTKVVMSGESC